ncbi:unnamed protein product [Bursaphelenchus xylophilus]|uniref:(pine wood nematode) hypothetical protein n=1 Tax=Bursaphelenchus xylophilus TaxID=6326 RepID=A0A1I7SCT2_BURXY|nr:unnamed protein product [Bursaphelenchus xylophilus]CAG9093539.1 unnamed protein product [Bursaphelenchus xylophilus]
MIPFSPHPSSGEAYKNSPVKWRSLTHLVQSRRSSTAELARNASHRRSQSTSAITPPHLRPPERRGSVEEKPRKSSLSGLIELKRFLPAAVQKTLSSSNSSLTQGMLRVCKIR